MKTSTPEMTLSGKITESGSRPKGEWQYQSADQSDCFGKAIVNPIAHRHDIEPWNSNS